MATSSTLLLRPQSVLLPQCHACTRRTLGLSLHNNAFMKQQVRGKKKMAKSTTIPVRLRRDMTGYGPEGAVVRVTRGQMRNTWYPSQAAEYIPWLEQKSLKLSEAVMTRKYNYVSPNDVAEEHRRREAQDRLFSGSAQGESPLSASRLEHQRPSADRSVELIEALIPQRISFHRVPIERQEKSTKQSDAAVTAKSPKSETVSALYDGADASSAQQVAIHGSVSSAEIATGIRAVLQEDDEAARIVLSDAEIKFVSINSEDAQRVRHTGDFDVEIMIKGSDKTIRRTIRVLPSEGSRETGTATAIGARVQ